MDRYELAASAENEGLWDWNLVTNRIRFSPRWISLLGLPQSKVGDTPEEWMDRVHPDDIKQLRQDIAALLAGNTTRLESRHRVLHEDGTHRWMYCRGMVTREDTGRAVQIIGSHSDITAERVIDLPTGLPNHLLLSDRLARSIEKVRRSSDFLFAVLVLDLGRPETRTEREMAPAGDPLLTASARRLETCLRAGDAVSRLVRDHVVARLGGDRFGILLEGLSEIGVAITVAELLLKETTSPFELDGHAVYVSASIGIALSPTGYSRPEEALRDADTALHRARSLGKGRCDVFDTAIFGHAQTQLSLESGLKQALERKEFRVLYQPIVSLATGRITGFEALLRWNHPVRGVISPLEFIPIAESTGLIIPLGAWVLQEACRQLKSWQKDPGVASNLTVAVNFSSLQFAQAGLLDSIAGVLKDTGLDPHCLALEVTESTLVNNPASVKTLLMQLRVMGVQIGLDDFGTGFSALGYLSQYPLDFLKIDRGFVRKMETSQDTLEIIRSISDMARRLGLHVIAEGIEHPSQQNVIRSLHCEYGQGFFFSRPVDADQATELLKKGLPLTQWTNAAVVLPSEHPAQILSTTCNSSLPETATPGDEPSMDPPMRKHTAGMRTIAIASAAMLLLLTVGLVVRLGKSGSQASGGSLPGPQLPMDSAHGRSESAQPEPSQPGQNNQTAPLEGAGSAPATVASKAVREKPVSPSVRPESPKKDTVSEQSGATVPDKKNQAAGAPTAGLDPVPMTNEKRGGIVRVSEFPVVHQHALGSCRGILKVSQEALSFDSEKGKDSFSLRYSEFSYATSNDQLTIRSSSRTYRFKSSAAGTKKRDPAMLQDIMRAISRAHPSAFAGKQ